MFSKLAAFIICAFSLFCVASAQSTDQNFPAAVTTNEIDGTIKARDIGDSRLTSYFYTFDGGQGDIFINVVTKNFSGDIDVFTVEGLRPLTKMVIYADGGGNETGRLVYLRKPERLILRIEGRSPNDDPATYRIKFAGSFIALSGGRPQEAPSIKAEVNEASGIRVNSVGTIVEVLPKPQPPPKATVESKEKVATVAKNKKPEAGKKPSPQSSATPKKEPKEDAAAAKGVIKKPSPTKPQATTRPAKEIAKVEKGDSTPSSKTPKKTGGSKVNTVFKKPTKTTTAERASAKPAEPLKESQPDPMASIRLIVQLKDGKVIERPMSEITKVSVDNGVLTVIAKDGTTVKYSILDVGKVTIE